MQGDFSRQTFDPKNRYNTVLMQQGRVQVDADWNEQQAIHHYRMETETRDLVGACGVPAENGGFKISRVGLFQDLAFVNAQIGWAVGNDGTILSTADGGQTWRPQVSGVEEDLDGVFFLNAQQGWVVGEERGVILATADGGQTWQPQVSRVEEDLYGVWFVSDRQGWVVGDNGTLLTTSNGGQTWSRQNAGVEVALRKVVFVNPQRGWVVGNGGTILSTTNGGQAWSRQTSGVTTSLRDLAVVGDRQGWVVGSGGTILTTTNGGETWIAQSSGLEEDLRGVAFVNSQRGWVVGGDGTILTTVNSGRTWTAQRSGVDDSLRGVVFVDDRRGWVATSATTILTTTNGGETWSLQFQAGELMISAGRAYVNGILCESDGALLSQQPDLPGATPLSPQSSGQYLIYLDVWKRHLTALDHPRIREVALGGPDTTTRLKTVWQVKVLPIQRQPNQRVTTLHCCDRLPEWDALTTPSTGRLNARTVPPSETDNPCLIPPTAGYQRLENQLYRVEIHQGSNPGPLTFKWSRDNGSVVTAIQSISGSQITVADLGPDEVLGFSIGQWVEVVDDRLELNGLPGQLVQIVDIDPAGNRITASTAVTPLSPGSSGINPNYHPKLRRWDQTGSSATATGIAITTGWQNLEGGIQVQFSAGTYKTGEYWTVPARTATGEIEWPPYQVPNSNPIPQLAFGIQHHYCRLALLVIDDEIQRIQQDCRKHFPPLSKCAMHVVAINWQNDDVLTRNQFFSAQGLQITLDAAPEALSVNSSTMIVTLEAPLISGQQDTLDPATAPDFSFILDGTINRSQLADRVIQWNPVPQSFSQLDTILRRVEQVRVRVLLKGSTIWSDQDDRTRTQSEQRIYLDGQALGQPGRRLDNSPRIDLEFPSGSNARATDFEGWFFLTGTVPDQPPPPLRVTTVEFIPITAGVSVTTVNVPPIPSAPVQIGATRGTSTIAITFNRAVRPDGLAATGPQSVIVELVVSNTAPPRLIPGTLTLVNNRTVRFVVSQLPNGLRPGAYRLTLLGNEANAPAIRAQDDGVALDGDFNNQPGGNFVLNFTIVDDVIR